jgi:hypothetical protein
MLLTAGYTALAQPVTVTYSYNGLPLPILPDSADTITIAQITVLRALTISKVTVQLQIQYPNTGDIYVYLFSPQGTRTILTEHDSTLRTSTRHSTILRPRPGRASARPRQGVGHSKRISRCQTSIAMPRPMASGGLLSKTIQATVEAAGLTNSLSRSRAIPNLLPQLAPVRL